MIRVTAFRWVPPPVQGLVRDLRVRWALEELGIPYDVRLIGPEDQASPAYRRQQPFGQVPVYEEDDLTLFESGAILHHIASRSDQLMPSDPAARARTLTGLFAAVNSVEPSFVQLVIMDLFYPNEDWSKARRPAVVELAQKRLTQLSESLGGREYLEGRFTVADLLMTTVLRIVRHTDLVARTPGLAEYQARCEARPAFARALAGQMKAFAENAPPAPAA
jgi:glutathione S-transferase